MKKNPSFLSKLRSLGGFFSAKKSGTLTPTVQDHLSDLVKEEVALEKKAESVESKTELSKLEQAAKNKELEIQLYMVQKSTKTTFPQFVKLHNKLRMRFKWYYNWHLWPNVNRLHWSALGTVTTVFAVLIISSGLAGVPTLTKASQEPKLVVTETNPVKTPCKFFFKSDSDKCDQLWQKVSDDENGLRIRTKSGTAAGYQDILILGNDMSLFDGDKLVATAKIQPQEQVDGKWQDIEEKSQKSNLKSQNEVTPSPGASTPSILPSETATPEAMINSVIQSAHADESQNSNLKSQSSETITNADKTHLTADSTTTLENGKDLKIDLDVKNAGQKQTFSLPANPNGNPQRIVLNVDLKSFDIKNDRTKEFSTSSNNNSNENNNSSSSEPSSSSSSDQPSSSSSEPAGESRSRQYNQVTLDTSDYKGQTKIEEKAASDEVNIIFNEAGSTGAIKIDPIFTVTPVGATITVDDGTRKWVFDTLVAGAPKFFYHTSVGAGADNIASTQALRDFIGPAFTYGGSLISSTQTLVENTPTRVKIRAQGAYATPTAIDNYYTIYPDGHAFLQYSETFAGATNAYITQHYLTANPQVQSYDNANLTFIQSDTANNNYPGMAVVPYTTSEFGGTTGWAATQDSPGDRTFFYKAVGAATYTGNMVIDFSNYRATTTTRDNLRLDYRTPATLANFDKGAVGAPAYSEGEGTYNITADGSGDAKFDFTKGTPTRYKPAFKITSATRAEDTYQVKVGGVLKTKGVDYNLSKIDATTVIVQWLSDVTTNLPNLEISGLTGVTGAQIAVGSYTGDGGHQSIAAVGFQPDLVIIKSQTTTQFAVFKTSDMAGDTTLELADAAGTFADGIESLDALGFSIGVDARVNTNAVIYHWQAFKNNGAADFTTGKYTGTGVDGAPITGLPFRPAIVTVKRDGASLGVWRPSLLAGDSTIYFAATTATAGRIKSLTGDGFTVGTNAEVNTSGQIYYWFAFAEVPGYIDVGSYRGDDADNRSITGVGFQPNLVWLKQDALSYNGLLRPSSLIGDSTLPFPAIAATSNLIQALESDGFQVGNNNAVNGSNLYYYYIAFKSGTVSFAGNKIWDGEGGDNNWSTADNWSDNVVPSASDTVVFGPTSTKDSTIDAPFGGTINSLTIGTGYTGTITAARSLSMAGDFSIESGIFALAAQTLSVNNLSIIAGTLSATTGTINVAGNWASFEAGGTWTRASSTVNLTGSGTVNMKSATDFYNLKCAYNGKTTTLSSSIRIYNILNTYSGGTFNGSQSINLYKNDGDPFVDTGTTISNSILYFSTASISVSGHNYATVYFLALTNDVTYTLTSNMTATGILAYGITAGKVATLSMAANNITTVNNIWLGSGSYAGSVDFGSGTHVITGDLKRLASATSVNNSINFNTANVSVAGTFDMTGITVTTVSGTVHLTATAAKNFTSNLQTLPNLSFEGTAPGSWQLQDNLTAASLAITGTGTLIDNAKQVTVNGDILIANTAGLLTSTGSWIQGASGNISNPNISNWIRNLTMAGAGVTTTLTGNVHAGSSASTTNTGLSIGNGNLNGVNFSISFYNCATTNLLTINNPTMGSALSSFVYFTYSIDQTWGALTFPNNFATNIVPLQWSGNVIASGNLNFGNNNVRIAGNSGGATPSTKYFDMSSSSLITTGNLYVGGYTSLNGWLKLGSNISHSVGGIAKGSTGTTDVLDMGSATITASGDVDFTGIAVTNGTGAQLTTMTGAGKTLTSAGNTIHNFAYNSAGTLTLADTYRSDGDFTITAGTVSPGNQTMNVGGSWDMSAGTFTQGTSTVNFTATIAGKSIKSGAQQFNILTFNGVAPGSWLLTDNLTALSINIGGTGKLIDNGKQVETTGADGSGNSIIIANTVNLLTSTGSWIQGASGNLSNIYYSNNKFSTFQIANGVTTTLTGNVNSVYLSIGTSAVLTGGFTWFIVFPTNNNFISQGAGSTISISKIAIFPTGASESNGALNTSSAVDIGWASSNTLQMTGAWTTGNLTIFGNTASISEATAQALDTNGNSLTVNGNLLLGRNASATKYQAKALFSSGTHNITGNVSVDSGTTYGYFNFGTTSQVTVGGNVDFTYSTVTRGTSTLVMNGTSKNLTGDSNRLYKLTISGTITIDSKIYVQNTLTVDADKILTISAEVKMESSTTVINGTITGSGTFRLEDTAGTNLSTGGTLSCLTRFESASTDITVPARTYGGEVQIYNYMASIATATLGTATGQTLTFSSRFYIRAMSTGNLVINASTYNPTVNITGDVLFTSNGGTPSITMGSGTWTVGGTVDLRNGTVTVPTPPTTAALVMNAGSGSKNLYANGTTFNNLDFNGAGTFVLQDDFSTNGYLKITNGTVDATSRTLNIAGDFNRAGGTFTTTGSTVNLNGNSDSLVHGSTTFNNLAITSNSSPAGKTVTFDQASTQVIGGALTMTGAAGKILTLHSSNSGNQWLITANGSRTVSLVDVQDSRNTDAASHIAATASHDGGNNLNWDFATTTASAITVPVEGAVVGGGTVQIQGTASAVLGLTVASVQVQVNGGSWVAATGTTSWSYDYAVSTSGAYTAKARAIDNLGTVGPESAAITFKVDTEIPSVVITKPVLGEWITSATYDITGTAADLGTSPIANIQVSFDGGTWHDATGTTLWTYTWTVVDGDHTLLARATDGVGNVSQSYTLPIKADTTAPSKPSNIQAFNVSNLSSAKQLVFLSWKASTDAGSGLKEYEVYRNGTKVATTTDNYYIDENIGTYQIKALDNAGNISASDEAKVEANTAEKPALKDVKATPSKIVSKDEKTTAIISWQTNTPTTSLVQYGLGGAKASQSKPDGRFNMGHTVVITDLKPQTTYHYAVSGSDVFANKVSSQDLTFTTAQAPTKEDALDVIIKTLQKSFEWFKKVMATPVLDKLGLIKSPEQASSSLVAYDVSSSDGTSRIFITTTNKGTIEKGTDGPSTALGVNCTVISGSDKGYYLDTDVKTGTTYYYRAKGVEGMVSVSPGSTSKTLPVISEVKATELSVSEDAAETMIQWQTDKLSDSTVKIGSKTYTDPGYGQSHTLVLSDLKPGQTVKYTVSSSTEEKITASSPEHTLNTSTSPAERTILEVIIDSLKKAFSGFGNWIRT